MIQAYIGDGKGKTTAALGLLIRAFGAGLKVKVIYFDKGGPSSLYHERLILERLNIPFEVTGLPRMVQSESSATETQGLSQTFRFGVTDEDKTEALRGVSLANTCIKCREFDLLVLDEILSAITYGLLSEKVLDELIAGVPGNLELVLTGRYQSDRLSSKVNLISRIEKVRHYFDQGCQSRPGIEF